jgi:two-component system, LytTR family, response regulator
MRAVIIDDEETGVTALKMLIEEHVTSVKVVATATHPLRGIDAIEEHRPDLVFLDVSMPQMDGFELLDRLAYKSFFLIFTTAHAEYAIKAIKSRAHDYLLKPVDLDELKRCVSSLGLRDFPSKPPVNRRVIEISMKDGIIFIKPEEIIRLEAAGAYTTFYLDNGIRHVASKNLKEYERSLEEPRFFRCHPSHIVNLTKVLKLVCADGLFAQMNDGSMPDVSRRNKDGFLERLKAL